MTVAVFCGTTDPFYPAARNLVSLMDFPHLARFGPGGHDPGYWRRVAPAQLRAIGGVRGSPQANRLSAEAGKSPQDVVEHPWLVGYADMKTLLVHLFNQFSLMYIRQMASSRQAAPAFLRLAGHPLRWRLLSELADSDLRVRELVALTGQPQNLVSYHLRLLRDGGLVTATRSTFDGRDSYYHLDLDHCARALAGSGRALHPALGATPALPPHSDAPVAVLFVCTGNSARSPMAEALLHHHAGGQIQATSAGTRPKPRLHACAVRVLRESYGIDISGHRPRDLRTLTGHRFDYVVSLCDKARETGFEFNPTARRIHWSIPDPVVAGLAGEAGYGAFAGAAAEVDSRIRHLLPVLATTVGKEIQP
jgi:protein-tyrosine-phosphatase/DNA-binding transcriptional ArsR family regulator